MTPAIVMLPAALPMARNAVLMFAIALPPHELQTLVGEYTVFAVVGPVVVMVVVPVPVAPAALETMETLQSEMDIERGGDDFTHRSRSRSLGWCFR
jgi:hypothetical protein